MSEPNRYYVVCFRLECVGYYLLWISSVSDRFLVSSNKRLVTFADTDSLAEFAEEKGLVIQAEKPPVFDFDMLVSACP